MASVQQRRKSQKNSFGLSRAPRPGRTFGTTFSSPSAPMLFSSRTRNSTFAKMFVCGSLVGNCQKPKTARIAPWGRIFARLSADFPGDDQPSSKPRSVYRVRRRVHDQREQDVDRGNRDYTARHEIKKSTTQERPPTGRRQSPPRQPHISDRKRSRTVLKGTAWGTCKCRSLGRCPPFLGLALLCPLGGFPCFTSLSVLTTG